MKYVLFTLITLSSPAYSLVWVDKHVAPDGTVIPAHYQTEPHDLNQVNFQPFNGHQANKQKDHKTRNPQRRQEQRAYNEALKSQAERMQKTEK
jgi:hypothetical protein